MTALLPPPPPRYWLAEILSPAFRRGGKIAAATVLAGLAVAIGLAFADEPAEAQGVHHGYTYTQRVCQEYGKQPRWYNVRDEMAGSDWRTDGGWAIILEGTRSVTATIYGPSAYSYFWTHRIEVFTPVRRYKTYYTDPDTGQSGFVLYYGNGVYYGNGNRNAGWVAIDQNKDYQITQAGDRTVGTNNERYEFRRFTRNEGVLGRSVRWANMQWCR